jgi:hypothetical protein
MEQFLRTYINRAQDDWVDWLPLVKFAGNNVVLETIGMSPFFTNYGFNPCMGVGPASPYPPELTVAPSKEFFQEVEIVNRFKTILDKLMAYSR